MYSLITSGRVLDGELLYTKILEVNLFAFAYRLFRRDFSPLDGTFCILHFALVLHWSTNAKCPVEWREISTKQSVGNANKLTSRIFVYFVKYIFLQQMVFL